MPSIRLFDSHGRRTLLSPDEEELLQPPQYEKGLPPTNDPSNKSQGLNSSRRPWSTWLPWLVAAAFAVSWLRLYLQDRTTDSLATPGTFELGWTSELYPARSQVQIEQRYFAGTKIPEGSLESIILDVKGPASDRAWKRVIGGPYILITEDEARRTWEGDIEEHWDYDWGGYRASLDVFHTLHCLNWFRMLNSTDLALVEQGEEPLPHHVHCLGQIRQYIMCHADLTPIPAAFGRGYPDQDWPHTCRNFDKIRDWWWDRYNGSLALPPVWDH